MLCVFLVQTLNSMPALSPAEVPRQWRLAIRWALTNRMTLLGRPVIWPVIWLMIFTNGPCETDAIVAMADKALLG